MAVGKAQQGCRGAAGAQGRSRAAGAYAAGAHALTSGLAEAAGVKMQVEPPMIFSPKARIDPLVPKPGRISVHQQRPMTTGCHKEVISCRKGT